MGLSEIKKNTENKNLSFAKTKRGKPMLLSEFVVSGSKKSQDLLKSKKLVDY